MKALPNMIANPSVIMKGKKENSLVLLSNIELNNKNILIPLHYDNKNGNIDIINVSSLYEKDNLDFFLEKQFANHNVIAFNTKKIEQYRELNDRLLLPMSDVCSIYDDSITNSLINVNIKKENFYSLSIGFSAFFSPYYLQCIELKSQILQLSHH